MSQLLEEILSKENMTQAYKHVKAKKGRLWSGWDNRR